MEALENGNGPVLKPTNGKAAAQNGPKSKASAAEKRRQRRKEQKVARQTARQATHSRWLGCLMPDRAGLLAFWQPETTDWIKMTGCAGQQRPAQLQAQPGRAVLQR